MSSPLADYLSQNPTPNPGFIAYLAALEQVASVSPDVAKISWASWPTSVRISR